MQHTDFDFIVIGSGFGGSVSAHRLTQKGYRVAVMEMGRRWGPQDFPRTNWLLWRWIWRPSLALRGFFNLELFRHVVILHGCAVGGGSITYCATLLAPKDSIWENGSWAGLAPWKTEMPSHYETASRMLGVTENRVLGPADLLLKQAADAVGVGDTYYRTRVGIYQAPEGEPGGETHPDPYFGGAGPERTTCTACGGCMIGCRYNAKNSLDKNYLYFAEKHGARVFAETKVVDVSCLNGKADGSDGYEVRTVKSTAWLRKEPRRYHLSRRGVRGFCARQHGSAVSPQGERLAAGDQRSTGSSRAHQRGIADRRPRPGQSARIYRRASPSVRGSTSTNILTSRRCVIRTGSDAMGLLCHAVDQRPARLDSNLADVRNLLRGDASPSHQDRAQPASLRLGARSPDLALYADSRRSHRYALGEALVLALPKSAGNQRAASPYFHSPSQRICP